MHITLIDDSVSFDGFSPSARALGGAEKAFASLPAALARRGHHVVVYNKCDWSMHMEGVQWEPLESRRPLTTDLLIAFRKTDLLYDVRQAGKRALWTTLPARFLDKKAARATLAELTPMIWFASQAAAQGCPHPHRVLPVAVRPDFLRAQAPDPIQPPMALVTTHPAQGLGWLLDLWQAKIHPAVPQAELHICSATLARAQDGLGVPPDMEDLAARMAMARSCGVQAIPPANDAAMALLYRQASLHLYPGHADDVTAFTLAESQAVGLPAVLRPLGAAPERVVNGQTAYVAPDDDAFANLTSMILANPPMGTSLSQQAKAEHADRSWDRVAEIVEGLAA